EGLVDAVDEERLVAVQRLHRDQAAVLTRVVRNLAYRLDGEFPLSLVAANRSDATLGGRVEADRRGIEADRQLDAGTVVAHGLPAEIAIGLCEIPLVEAGGLGGQPGDAKLRPLKDLAELREIPARRLSDDLDGVIAACGERRGDFWKRAAPENPFAG